MNTTETSKTQGEETMDLEISERYINPYTDFGFKKLFEQAEVARFTPQERNEYVASKKEYWDNYSALTTSYNRGKAEAEAKAREEKLDSARKMKAKGFSDDDIVEIIGITPEELRTL